MKKSLSLSKGFTLIELLVVIAIIGLLSSVVLASLNSARDKATAAKVVSEMKALQSAIELYRLDHDGSVPHEGTGEWFSDYGGEQGNYEYTLSYALQDLITGGYIYSIPHAPEFPNNTQNELSYLTKISEPGANVSLHCGTVGVAPDYLILFYNNDETGKYKVNLPEFIFLDNGVPDPNYPGYYCISG